MIEFFQKLPSVALIAAFCVCFCFALYKIAKAWGDKGGGPTQAVAVGLVCAGALWALAHFLSAPKVAGDVIDEVKQQNQQVQLPNDVSLPGSGSGRGR